MVFRRLRRYRRSESITSLVREVSLSTNDFIYPLFVKEGLKDKEPISSMPGKYRHSLDSMLKEVEYAYQLGIKAIIIFGIPSMKSEFAEPAYSEDGIVQQAVRTIKKHFPQLTVFTDVCMCSYTTHGHCGIVEGGQVENDKSLEILGKIAVSHADAGADFVAPSAMMDGQVYAIRTALDKYGYTHIGIMSYSAKYASAFYGPFRDAADSSPQYGDRTTYQMDPGSSRQALLEVLSDIEEGADIVMVKPGMAYLDIVATIRNNVLVPVAVYNVSGEYSMIKLAAEKGYLNERLAVMELMLAFKRAGADLIISYHALEIAEWLQKIKS